MDPPFLGNDEHFTLAFEQVQPSLSERFSVLLG
jgi:hypothetical protein